jgi:hypothetical protein
MIYALNIVTVTKSTDVYDAVAVNKYPLLITCEKEEFEQFLKSERMVEFCKQYIKSKNLYDHSKFYVRAIDDEQDITVENIILNVSDYIEIKY